MLLLDENDIQDIGINWNQNLLIVKEAVNCLDDEDFAQPVKPYLRYRDLKNRIIAMPAFVGGNINMAGIKWIASFPDNIKKGIPRAHSVVILNNADTGEPLAIICTPLLSIIRTASVSGLVIKSYNDNCELRNIKIGIIGFGPIGQYHLQMCLALLGDRISEVLVYDILPVHESTYHKNKLVKVVDCWEDAYIDSDIMITCTVSSQPYIDKAPKKGSLHLNVSLRDYKTSTYKWFKGCMIVDSWEEVCRENTDIERMHLEMGLAKEHTKSLVDVVKNNCFNSIDRDSATMFNPMGMAVFDVAFGSFYYNRSQENKV
jgi:2,3-diaminopropionate biosynthesis protein SbnB